MTTQRFPAVDGLRAVCIALVVLGHVFWLFPGFHFLHHFALFGVRVFFVVSGFLITNLLQAEWTSEGRIALGAFYKRRFWRLMPSFYAYILFALIMTAAGVWPLHPRDFLYAALHLMNYYPGGATWVLGHFWSLAVEEQFYLLWPLMLALLAPAGARRILFMTLLLAPLTRYVLFPWRDSLGNTYGTMFPSVCDALATGCLLAMLRRQLHGNRRYTQLIKSNVHLVLLPIMAAMQLAFSPKVSAVFGPVGMNLAIALLIDGSITFPAMPLHRLLSSSFPRLVGRMSYSLYLWQQPFFGPGHDKNWHIAVNFVLACLCAAASYFLIESPLRRYGSKVRQNAVREESAAMSLQ